MAKIASLIVASLGVILSSCSPEIQVNDVYIYVPIDRNNSYIINRADRSIAVPQTVETYLVVDEGVWVIRRVLNTSLIGNSRETVPEGSCLIYFLSNNGSVVVKSEEDESFELIRSRPWLEGWPNPVCAPEILRS